MGWEIPRPTFIAQWTQHVLFVVSSHFFLSQKLQEADSSLLYCQKHGRPIHLPYKWIWFLVSTGNALMFVKTPGITCLAVHKMPHGPNQLSLPLCMDAKWFCFSLLHDQFAASGGLLFPLLYVMSLQIMGAWLDQWALPFPNTESLSHKANLQCQPNWSNPSNSLVFIVWYIYFLLEG